MDLVIRQGLWPHALRSKSRYALTTSWRTYTLTITAPATESDQVMVALAQSRGTVWIDGVHFQRGDPNIWQRTFSNGMVILNESAGARIVSVGAGYRHILGTQHPSLNDGAPVVSVRVPPSDAVFLVRR
jgi:ligand-binding sensor domain-containing protein